MGNRPERLRVQNCGHVIRLDRYGYYEGKEWDPTVPCPDCRRPGVGQANPAEPSQPGRQQPRRDTT